RLSGPASLHVPEANRRDVNDARRERHDCGKQLCADSIPRMGCRPPSMPCSPGASWPGAVAHAPARGQAAQGAVGSPPGATRTPATTRSLRSWRSTMTLTFWAWMLLRMTLTPLRDPAQLERDE